jgi:hypothetical protein
MYYHPFAGVRCKTQTSTTKKGINMDNENKRNWTTGEATQLMRIADALEEILRLVKKDQEQMQRYKEETTEKWDRETN